MLEWFIHPPEAAAVLFFLGLWIWALRLEPEARKVPRGEETDGNSARI